MPTSKVKNKPSKKPDPKNPASTKKAIKTPVSRSHDIEVEILARMSKGEPLAVICRSNPERFPDPTTWNDWCVKDKELGIAHGRARDEGFDSIAHDCMHICDANGQDVYVTADGEARVNTEIVQRSKLRVETRLKLLAKWDPRRYGERIEPSVTINHLPPAMTPELAAEMESCVASIRDSLNLPGK